MSITVFLGTVLEAVNILGVVTRSTGLAVVDIESATVEKSTVLSCMSSNGFLDSGELDITESKRTN